MTSANDICRTALKKSGVLGVGQDPLAEDLNDAFSDLKDMMAQWQRNRWLVYHLVDIAFTSTGAVSYTVGAQQNFNVTRPDRIEAGYFRQYITADPNEVDYPCEILESREDYSRIRLKTLSTFPRYMFYDSAYPVGNLYPWPVPQSGSYEIHILLKEQLQSFANLATALALPPEYNAALYWNLAVWLRESYQMEPRESLNKIAAAALDTIQTANFQIARLTMPTDLMRPGVYNIFADSSQ